MTYPNVDNLFRVVPCGYSTYRNLNEAKQGRGWITIGDMVLYMPICLFVKVCRLSYEIPGLKDYLSDPDKRFTYVKDLPDNMKIPILYKRDYIHSIHGIVKLLSFMGLIFFDITKKLIKTQQIEESVMDVHKRASCVDTSMAKEEGNKRTEDLHVCIMNYPVFHKNVL